MIEKKYVEFPLARITCYDVEVKKCTTDWKRHIGQWYPIHEGYLEDCLKLIEESYHYFM